VKKYLSICLLVLAVSCSGMTILPPDFVSVPGSACIGWNGATNGAIKLWACSELGSAQWQCLATNNAPAVNVAAPDGFQIPLADLEQFNFTKTNIVEEFHGWKWVTWLDFSTHYEWVDQTAATNIVLYSQCFFRLSSGSEGMTAATLQTFLDSWLRLGCQTAFSAGLFSGSIVIAGLIFLRFIKKIP